MGLSSSTTSAQSKNNEFSELSEPSNKENMPFSSARRSKSIENLSVSSTDASPTNLKKMTTIQDLNLCLEISNFKENRLE